MSFLKTLERRRIVNAVVVLLVAFACGHLMQNVLTDHSVVAMKQKGPDAALVLKSLEEPKPFPTPPAATLVPILSEPPVLPTRATETRADDGSQASVVACDPRLFVTPTTAAMLELTLQAPCHGDTLVEISQGPLAATQSTNANGHLHVRLPALEVDAKISVSFADLELVAELKIPDAVNFQHIALIWQGPQILRMNAFEFGAARNEVGHVWAGAPKSPTRASHGTGGYLTRLVTENGPSAEIYSLPAGQSPMRGVVRLVVEANVTQQSCGRVIKAKAFQPTAFRRFSQTDVEVALPDCDRLGEVVLLQNLLRDVRLAGR